MKTILAGANLQTKSISFNALKSIRVRSTQELLAAANNASKEEIEAIAARIDAERRATSITQTIIKRNEYYSNNPDAVNPALMN